MVLASSRSDQPKYDEGDQRDGDPANVVAGCAFHFAAMVPVLDLGYVQVQAAVGTVPGLGQVLVAAATTASGDQVGRWINHKGHSCR